MARRSMDMEQEMLSWTPALPKLQVRQSVGIFHPAMVELSRRRRETAALRKRWLSVGGKQTSRVTRIGVDSRREAHRAQMFGQARSQKDSKEHPGTAPGAIVIQLPTSQPLPILPPAQLSSSSTPTSISQPPTSQSPGQAAITKRPSRILTPTFRALTQISLPLPHLLETSPYLHVRESATSVDIQEWRNQVVKVVPERPQLVFRLGSATSKKECPNFRYPYKVINLDPATHFYRSWSKVKDKDYIISPDWISEKLWNLRTNKCPNNIAGPRVTQL